MNIIDAIMDTLNNIEYGFKDSDGFNIINDENKWNDEFYEFYYLLSPEELLNTKCGVCWDQVELERKLFNDNNIQCSTYFIYLDDGADLPSHTFLTYQANNKYYWFEHSWYDYKGIHEYNTLNELLNDVKEKFVNSKDAKDKYPILIYKYNKPRYHIDCESFYKYINTQQLIK